MSDEFATDMKQLFGDRMAWAMGPPEPEKDWNRSTPTKFVQKKDPTTELLAWLMIVADPTSRTQRRVKILCDDEPVIPEPTEEWPFVGVEFIGLTVRPWLNDRGCKPARAPLRMPGRAEHPRPRRASGGHAPAGTGAHARAEGGAQRCCLTWSTPTPPNWCPRRSGARCAAAPPTTTGR